MYFRERLAPQKAGKTPLDMDQFRMLFCTCKVPGVKKDTIHNYFKTGGRKPLIFNLQTYLCKLWPTWPSYISLLCNVHFLLCDRERGSMPVPFGRDVSWADVHI